VGSTTLPFSLFWVHPSNGWSVNRVFGVGLSLVGFEFDPAVGCAWLCDVGTLGLGAVSKSTAVEWRAIAVLQTTARQLLLANDCFEGLDCLITPQCVHKVHPLR